MIAASALLAATALDARAEPRGVSLATPGTAVSLNLSGVSADGSREFYLTTESRSAADTDASGDVYERRNGIYTLLTDRQQPGSDLAADATFEGATADGSRVFISTAEPLTSADTDAMGDVYMRSGTTTTLLSDGPSATDPALGAFFEGASADGTRVWFATKEQIDPDDDDAEFDVYERAAGTTLVSDRHQGGADAELAVAFAGASDDGTRVFFTTDGQLVDADNDDSKDVYSRASGSTAVLSERRRSGFDEETDASFRAASADGTHVFFTTGESIVAADGDSATDVYERSGTSTLLRSDRVQAGTDEEKRRA